MSKKKKISVDQVFSNDNSVVFIEQKIRDDHDTSKWEGQWNNFEYKLKVLTEIYKEKGIIGIMWMIDDNFERNKETFYIKSQEKILNNKKHPHCDKLECKLLNRLEDALVILLLFV